MSILLLAFCRPVQAEWLHETIGESGWLAQSTTVAIDPAGTIHVGYHNDSLHHAHRDGTSWVVETVDAGSDRGFSPSMVLTTEGDPCFSYYDYGGTRDLRYAGWDGSAWQVEIVDSVGDVGDVTSLALDSTGRPHIAYQDCGTLSLKYGRWDGADWWIETVDSSGMVAFCTSLALDPSDRPRIAYYDYGNGDLKLASWSDLAWEIEVLDSDGDVGVRPHLLSQGDRLHLAYEGDLGEAVYATREEGGWTREIIDQSAAWIWLALRPGGEPVASYYDSAGENLKFAARTGTGWEVETVDAPGDTGFFSSCVLDGAGRAHISYVEFDDMVVRFAYQPSPTPPPTLTAVPSPTHTAGPAPTETPSPTLEPTAPPTHPFGVRLDLPTLVHPGEPFRVTGRLDNPGPERFGVPTFFILEVDGTFWFWPGWCRYDPPTFIETDYQELNIPTGGTEIQVVPELLWPDTGSAAAEGLRFYGACLNEAMDAIEGAWDMVEWGYGPR